jgi:hypothetical protein
MAKKLGSTGSLTLLKQRGWKIVYIVRMKRSQMVACVYVDWLACLFLFFL